MGEEMRASQTGPNGERLELRVGTKSLGLTTGNLTMILFIALVGVLGYLRSVALTKQLEQLYGRQSEIITTLQTQLGTIRDTSHDERQFLLERFQESRQHLDDQTATLRKYLLQHEANQGRSSPERLPLELAPEPREPAPR